MLLNNSGPKRKSQVPWEKEKRSTTFQKVWDGAKAILRGKVHSHRRLKNQDALQINNPALHLKELDKKNKQNINRRNEIIKIRMGRNENRKFKKDNRKDQCKLVLWKDKENWKTFSQTHQGKRENPN